MQLSTLRVSTCAALMVTVLVALTPRTLGVTAGTWDLRAPMPTGRMGSPHAVIDGKLYVASGCCVDPLSTNPTRFTALEIYDPAMNSWSTGADIPFGVYAATAGAIDGMLYVAGGQEQFGNVDKLQVYNTLTDSWSQGPAMPAANAGSAGGAIGGKLYVATGMDPGNTTLVDTLRIFEPGSGWTTGASIPTARAHAGAAVLDGKLYVAGGLTSVPVDNFEVYDPVGNAWQVLAPMPTARYGAGLAVVDGILYAVGGTDNVHFLDTVEAYDPATNTWTPLDPMPEAHYYPAGVATLNGELHVIGGIDASGAQSMSNHRLTLTLPVAPTLQISNGAGTYTYNGNSHSVSASATGTGGGFVNGTISVTYDPGGATPPRTVGSYDVNITFTSNDPAYTDAFLSVPDAVVINPSVANVNGPMSVTREATGPDGAAVTFSVNAFDFDGPLMPVCTPPSGSVFPVGSTPVNCTANGPNSVPGMLSFNVTVTDTQRPVIGPAANVFATATSAAGATVDYDLPFIADLADPNPTVTTSHASGSLFPHGNTTVVITVTDASNNVATRNFTVTVNAGLQSIAVSPGTATVAPGGSQQFSALGAFTDGTSKILQGPGSGPPNSGPGNHRWQARFVPSLNAAVCGASSGGIGSQGFTPNASGAVDQLWGQNNVLRATGTADGGAVSLTIACTAPGVTASVSFTAPWTGTRYESTVTDFAGNEVQVQITGWSSHSAMSAARFGLGAATLDVNGRPVVYVVGGVLNGAASNLVEVYHPLNYPAPGVWTSSAAMPTAREGAGVVALNNQLFVVGGSAGGVVTGAVESYDPYTGVWTTWPALPTPRANLSLVAANGRLYAIGGTSAGGVVDTVESFDPASGWTTLAPLPVAREGSASAALSGDGLIVVAGGAVGGVATNRVDLYDVATNSWRRGPNLLAPTAGATSVTAMNAMFVFGGSNNGALSLSEMYRPASAGQPDGWAAHAAMPTARARAAAALVGDVAYMFGGQTGFPVPQTPVATIEAFSLPTPGFFSLSQGSNGSNAQPTVTWRLSPASGVATISPFGLANATGSGQVSVIAEAAGVSCETTNSCGRLTVEAPDTTPPTITRITPNPFLVLVPSGQLIPVTLSISVTDDRDPAPTCGVAGVLSNEPVGTTSPDWVFSTTSTTLQVRAERNPTGGGRAYLIVAGCADRSGNTSYGLTLVIVPRLF